jgi:hypothetical protein
MALTSDIKNIAATRLTEGLNGIVALEMRLLNNSNGIIGSVTQFGASDWVQLFDTTKIDAILPIEWTIAAAGTVKTLLVYNDVGGTNDGPAFITAAFTTALTYTLGGKFRLTSFIIQIT